MQKISCCIKDKNEWNDPFKKSGLNHHLESLAIKILQVYIHQKNAFELIYRTISTAVSLNRQFYSQTIFILGNGYYLCGLTKCGHFEEINDGSMQWRWNRFPLRTEQIYLIRTKNRLNITARVRIQPSATFILDVFDS